MGKLFKAVAGFAVALTLLHGQGYWAGWQGLAAVKSQIANTQPLARLAAQIGTPLEARGLHRTGPKPEGLGR